MARTITLAFTGASGMPFGLRLLECLVAARCHVYLLYSPAAQIVAKQECALTILFESFGFKHGVPLDADLVFDVRCLPNPHYEEALAPLTGRDQAVVDFLERAPEVERMYSDVYHFVSSWLPDYARDNRNYLTVAIGCTGGRHRSVFIANVLGKHLEEQKYRVKVSHRDSEK